MILFQLPTSVFNHISKEGKAVAQWCVDALSWLQSLIGFIIRDVWVHPRRNTAGSQLKRHRVWDSAATTTVVDADHVRQQLMTELRKQELPLASLNSCFRWLRNGRKFPPMLLRKDNKVLTLRESHLEWCRVFSLQSRGAVGICEENVRTSTEARWVSARGRNMKLCGNGQIVKAITWTCVQEARKRWKTSRAITPLLLPRALFLAGDAPWDELVYILLRLAGHGKWAVRAFLWRLSVVDVTFKSGDVTCADNWRFLFVKDQMGLLQEACLALLVKPILWPSLSLGQSGYTRGRSVNDPILLLHDLARMVIDSHRCFSLSWGISARHIQVYGDRTCFFCYMIVKR